MGNKRLENRDGLLGLEGSDGQRDRFTRTLGQREPGTVQDLRVHVGLKAKGKGVIGGKSGRGS